ncbi:hypothetical protein NPIL_145901, partial [Nephila pilipes]
YLKLAETFGTEEEAKNKGEFKETYSKLDEEEQKELKECLQKIVEIISNEVREIPEGCEGRTEAWFDSLTT